MIKILVAEDDRALNELVCTYMKANGYDATPFFNGKQALDALQNESYDLIITDVMMPQTDGFALAQKVRETDKQIPILFMTALDDKISKQRGYMLGIDDYVVKPFDCDLLLLRVGALLRRANIERCKELTAGNLRMNKDEHTAYRDGEELPLTVREFDLLFKLLSFPKRTFTRAQLMNEFWDYDSSATSRTVDVYMAKLREKTAACTGFEIVTVHGLGYKASGGNRAVIAGVMLAIIVALALIGTFIDYLRRKYTVDKTVGRILDATDRIASGDFSIRLTTAHALPRYDEYDRIIENLNRMTEELSRTEVLHVDFIANVSHELKTPLAVIQNYATLLQNADLSADDRLRHTKTLEMAAKKLTALVVNILKLHKLENQAIRPEYEKVNVRELLENTVLQFEDGIDRKQLLIDCNLEDAVVYSSPSYLEIVWNNLLSNAVKFTPEGGRITISVSETSENTTVVKVADTGCGISEETGQHIFDKFYQGDTSHSAEGNGLGLALVKKVIDILGGEISVESETGKGSVFTVVLKGATDEMQQ